MTDKKVITKEEAISYLEWIRPIKPYSLDRIKVQQAIDLAIKALEERSQGKWKKIGEEYYNWHNHTVIKCLHCGYVKDIPGESTPHFCEDCGADMRDESIK